MADSIPDRIRMRKPGIVYVLPGLVVHTVSGACIGYTYARLASSRKHSNEALH
jgi:hypothetical protein